MASHVVFGSHYTYHREPVKPALQEWGCSTPPVCKPDPALQAPHGSWQGSGGRMYCRSPVAKFLDPRGSLAGQRDTLGWAHDCGSSGVGPRAWGTAKAAQGHVEVVQAHGSQPHEESKAMDRPHNTHPVLGAKRWSSTALEGRAPFVRNKYKTAETTGSHKHLLSLPCQFTGKVTTPSFGHKISLLPPWGLLHPDLVPVHPSV